MFADKTGPTLLAIEHNVSGVEKIVGEVQVQVKSPLVQLKSPQEGFLEGVQDVVRQKAQEKPSQEQVQNEVQVKPSQEVLHEEDQEGDSVPMEGYQSENEHRSAKEKIEELKAALP